MCAENTLYCGTGKQCITPPAALLPQLFSVMPFTHFDQVDETGLWVRALALQSGGETLLLVACELDQVPFPAAAMDRIAGEYGIPVENIFMLGNHSHEVPVTGVRAAEPEHNLQRQQPAHLAATQAYEGLVEQALQQAVAQAMQSLQPARMGWAEGESFINEHRELGHPSIYPVDRGLFLLKVESEAGAPLAFLLNYSTHNSCVKSDHIVTADLEGAVARLMEAAFPGSVALWTLAAHGDLMPRKDIENIPLPKEVPAFAQPEAEDFYFRRLWRLALRQTEDAAALARTIQCGETAEGILGATVMVKVPTHPLRPLPEGGVQNMGGLTTISAQQRGQLRPREAQRLEQALESAPEAYTLRLHMARIGRLVLLGNGGKLYNAHKIALRGLFPPQWQTVMLSQDCCDSSNITYVWDDQALYEAAERGEPVLLRPGELQAALCAAARQLQRQLGIEAVPAL